MRIFLLSLVTGAMMALTACSPTSEILGSYRIIDEQTTTYKRLAVLALTPNVSNRAIVEMALAKELQSRKVKAIATFDLFQFAGQLEELGIEFDKETMERKIREKIAENEIDAVLILTVLDKQEEERYVSGSSFSVGYPVYSYPYYGYYSYYHSTVYRPGYYEKKTTYFVESNLYDIASEKLIWTGQTKVSNPSSVSDEAPAFAKVLVDEMFIKEALKVN